MVDERSREQSRIVRGPGVLGGKPVVRGTRIPVELVLGHLAGNPELDDLFAAYPRLTGDDVKAVLAFARDLVESGATEEPGSIPALRRWGF